MDTSQTDVTTVIPTFKSIPIAGESLEVRTFKVGALPAVLLAVQPIAHMLMQKDKPLDLTSMFMLHADDCLNLLSALSGKPRVWVDGLEMDEAITLFSALFEVNLDFFVQRVLPLLPDVLEHLRTVMENLTAKATQIASNF